jgi:FkbM family methyltransferase
MASGARRIILIEPNPEVLPELKRQAECHANVHVLPVAVAAELGKRALKQFNDPDLSSLRQPTGLLHLLPGLHQTGQEIVEVIPAHSLPGRFGLEGMEDNWLIIDTPGEEAVIISVLEQHRQLQYFDRIIVRAGAASFYEGAVPAEQLVHQLERLGYYLEGAEDNTDRDWPRHHLRLNHKAIECRRLRRRIDELSEQKGLLEKQNQQLTEQLQRQEDEVRKVIDNLESTQQEAGQQVAELQEQVKELQGKLDQQEQSHKDDRRQKESLQAERDALRKELDGAREELRQQRSDVAVALRLQNLRENDLKELQERYGQLRQTSQAQKELLGKLHQRLSVAADYLRLMNERHDERDELQEGLVRALTGNQSEDA